MTRPKNTVRLNKGNKEGTLYDFWFDTKLGRTRIRRATTTILKAVLCYHGQKVQCQFIPSEKPIPKKEYSSSGMFPHVEIIKSESELVLDQCFLCGVEEPLEKHHINGRWDDSRHNQIVLCRKQHRTIHKLAKIEPEMLALAFAVNMGKRNKKQTGVTKEWIRKLQYILE